MPYFDAWYVPLIVIFAIPFVGGPVLMWFAFELKSPTRVEYLDSRSMSLPHDVNEFVRPACRQLVKQGFKVVAFFRLPDLVPNARSVNVSLINLQTRESAMVNCIFADGLLGTIKNKYVEFITRFDDDVCLQTNNSSQLSAFRHEPDDYTCQFPKVQDVEELYRLHGEIGQLLSAAPRKLRLVEEFKNDFEAYLQKAVVQEPADYQVEQGLMRRTERGYGLTLKGAILFAWQEMYPWKLFRKWARRRNSEKWLSEINARPEAEAEDIFNFDDE